MSPDQPDLDSLSIETSPLGCVKLTTSTNQHMRMEHILSMCCIDQSSLFINDFHSSLLEDCQLFSFNSNKTVALRTIYHS